MSDKVIKNKNCKMANKSSKPLLERQRRARINNSLNELKSLVLSSLYQNCPQAEQNCEKMEKAEILELTVNFLKVIQSRRNTGLTRVESDKVTEFDATTAYGRVNLTKSEQPEIRRREQPLTYSYPSPPAEVVSPAHCPACVTISRPREVHSTPRYSVPTTCGAPLVHLTNGQHTPVNTHTKTLATTHRPLYTRVQIPSNKIQVWRPW